MSYCIDCGATTQNKIPDGDNRERMVCPDCGAIHYQNPKIVVGCIPEIDDSILLCRRAIEPRYGFWTVPAGFLEIGETLIEGAIRETKEEAGASVEIGHLFASVDVIGAAQIHVFFTAKLLGDFLAGQESLEVQLFNKNKIPWEELAFQSGIFALKKYLQDKGKNNGIHYHTLVKKKS